MHATFSWTVSPKEGTVWRQLSVSVERRGRYPQPVMVWTLARYFGFLGATPDNQGLVHEKASDWGVDINQTENTLVVIQKVDEASLSQSASASPSN